jgi:tetratricopeptide (TPR) repeat protein
LNGSPVIVFLTCVLQSDAGAAFASKVGIPSPARYYKDMSRTRFLAALLPLAGAILLFSGCTLPRPRVQTGTNPGETLPISTDPEMVKTVSELRPLPRIAEEHPAPENLPSIDMAETAQSKNPDGPQENLTLALCYYRARAFADAAPAFERAARLLPNDPKPLLFLGYTQMAAGAQDSAVATFERILRLKGVSREIQSEAYLQIGNAHGAMGRMEKAVEAFTKSIGHNPKQGLASLALGAWAAEKKQWGQAKDFFTDAANDLPPGRHRAQAYAALGRVAEAQKDTKTALAQYRKALASDDENEWAQDGVKRLGDPQKARSDS